MARIIQSLTQPNEEYDQQIQQSFVRDVDSIVQKLNTTYQQDLKDEANSFMRDVTLEYLWGWKTQTIFLDL